MRGKRLVIKGTACYHVMSRIIERRFYLGTVEKEQFCSMLHRAAEFSGIKILTYCVMDNHFHLLVEVPEPELLDDAELVRRMGFLYDDDRVESFRKELLVCRENEDQSVYESIRNRYICRMFSLSEFVKTLKQRFSIWYNRTHNRKGTLWEERFKSVLVESACYRMNRSALLTVARYIDTNAVRAGLVDDPQCYRWCGCGGGKNDAEFRKRCAEAFSGGVGGTFERGPRIGALSNGLVVGQRSFVDSVIATKRENSPERRRVGACVLHEAAFSELFVGRRTRPLN